MYSNKPTTGPGSQPVYKVLEKYEIENIVANFKRLDVNKTGIIRFYDLLELFSGKKSTKFLYVFNKKFLLFIYKHEKFS